MLLFAALTSDRPIKLTLMHMHITLMHMHSISTKH